MSEFDETIIGITAEVVAAHVANNSVAISDVPKLIESVHAAFSGLGSAVAAPTVKQEPAVAIRNSVKPDYIICLEDGRKLKTLKRHLMGAFGMTPKDYRAKWDLPTSYPMVAPNYAETRRALAVKIGLGRQRGPRQKK